MVKVFMIPVVKWLLALMLVVSVNAEQLMILSI